MLIGAGNHDADRAFDDWQDEGRRRFGIFTYWWFRCPKCGLAFTPEHLGDAGVVGEEGSICVSAIGGCGFPFYGTTTIGEFRRTYRTLHLDRSGMVKVAKDGRTTTFRVFPFCPETLIPADGRPTIIVMEEQ